MKGGGTKSSARPGNRARRLLLWLVVMVAASVATMTLFSVVVRSVATREWLERRIGERTGLSADVRMLRLGWTWRPFLYGRGLVLRDPSGGREILSISRFRIVPSLGALVRGKFKAAYLEIIGATIWLRKEQRNRDGSGAPVSALAVLLKAVEVLRLKQCKVLLPQMGLSLSGLSSEIIAGSSLNPSLSNFKVMGRLEGRRGPLGIVTAQGRIGSTGDVDARVRIREIALSSIPVPSLGKKGMGAPSLKGTGELELSFGSTAGGISFNGQILLSNVLIEAPRMIERPVRARSVEGTFKGSAAGGEWQLSEVNLSAGRARLAGWVRKGPDGVRAKVRGSEFSFMEVIPYLGEGLIGAKLKSFFMQNVLGGRGRYVEFDYAMDGRGRKADLRMTLEFQDSSMIFDPGLPPLTALQGRLFWQGDKVWFEGLKGRYAGYEIQRMAASISEIGRRSTLKGRFSLELPPKELARLLQSVSDVKLAREMVRKWRGSCRMDLAIEKSFLIKKDPLRFSGRIKLRDLHLEYAMMKKLRVAGGELYFSSDKFIVRWARGTLMRALRWNMEGVIDRWAGGRPRMNLKGKVEAETSWLLKNLASAHTGIPIKGEGPVEILFTLRGPLAEPAVGLSADLTEASLGMEDRFGKPKGMEMGLQIQAKPLEGGLWEVEKGKLSLPPAEILFKALFVPARGGEGSLLQWWGSGIPAKKLVEVVPALRDWILGGHLDLQGQGRADGVISWEATFSPRGLLIRWPLSQDVLTLESGTVRYSGGKWSSEGLQVEGLGAYQNIEGILESDAEGFRLAARLTGEGLDLSRFLSSKVKSSGRGAGSDWLRKFSGSSVTLILSDAKMGRISWDDLSAVISLDGERIALKEAIGRMAGGTSRMEGIWQPDKGEWRLKVSMDGVESQDVLNALGITKGLIEAPMWLNADVRGGLKGKVITYEEGRVQLLLKDGLIRKSPILANILSIMNPSQFIKGKWPVLSSQGMRFNEIRGTFDIEDGVARTEDFRMDSESMGVTMVGEIDLSTLTCDLKVGVQPFVAIDRLIDKIPLVRHYLAGKDRSVVATYFLVRGPLDNPRVTPIPFRSLGEGIIGMFKRLLENPFKNDKRKSQ